MIAPYKHTSGTQQNRPPIALVLHGNFTASTSTPHLMLTTVPTCKHNVCTQHHR
jgi:hypothetical protein